MKIPQPTTRNPYQRTLAEYEKKQPKDKIYSIRIADFALFVAYMDLPVDVCQELYEKYGRGYIYTPSGSVYPDKFGMREALIHMYTTITVIDRKGRVFQVYDGKARANARKKRIFQEVARKNAIEARKKERAEYQKSRNRQRMFSDGLNRRPCKHGGQGKSMPEHAQAYVFRPCPSMD